MIAINFQLILRQTWAPTYSTCCRCWHLWRGFWASNRQRLSPVGNLFCEMACFSLKNLRFILHLDIFVFIILKLWSPMLRCNYFLSNMILVDFIDCDGVYLSSFTHVNVTVNRVAISDRQNRVNRGIFGSDWNSVGRARKIWSGNSGKPGMIGHFGGLGKSGISGVSGCRRPRISVRFPPKKSKSFLSQVINEKFCPKFALLSRKVGS